LREDQRFPNSELPAIVSGITRWWRDIASHPRASIVLASVNDREANRIRSAVEDQLGVEVYRVGEDLPIPIGRQLDPETITGVDRLLNAAAAFQTVKQACIVVDAGTAVTVDFVDGEGVFVGGAIAPALHEHTHDLPELTFEAPTARTFGRSTAQAMLNGVYHGIRGMVWKLVEHYAERYGAFPMVIATGGDAQLLFGNDELVDRIVPNLTVLGIAAAARVALASDDADVRR
jgi:type III pantothenate kinase